MWGGIKNLCGSRSQENYVRAESGAWEKGGFRDYDPGDDDPRTVIYEDNRSCSNWRGSFKETKNRINAARFPYGASTGPNSNSVVREMLESAGLSPSLPTYSCRRPGLTGLIFSIFGVSFTCEVSAPGWNYDLFP